MASVRLSSSRNCENSGAKRLVSAWAARIVHHFWIITVSDQIDMNARTKTMPFAKYPIWPHSCISDRFIRATPEKIEGGGAGGSLLCGTRRPGGPGSLHFERERLLDDLRDLAPARFGREELHAGHGL